MKAKIAKQEGECRQAKRLNEQLERQVKMLEMALRNERAKSKGGKVEEKKSAEPEKENKKNGEEKGKKATKRARKGSVLPSRRHRHADISSQRSTGLTTLSCKQITISRVRRSAKSTSTAPQST